MKGELDDAEAMIVPELTARPRQGYARGAQGVEQILRKSEQLLIGEGLSALTLRRIAAECGMTQGNLSYYFKSKGDLMMALIDAITESYRTACEQIVFDPGLPPLDQLCKLSEIYLGDIATRRTTRIFTELWAISSRDPQVAAKLKLIYDSAAGIFAPVAVAVNPELGEEEAFDIALSIIAILEGQTAFIGNAMPYADQRERFTARALAAVVELVTRRTR